MSLNNAVFIDKDGTLVKNIPYNVELKKIRFFRGVAEGLKLLADASYKLVIVTNQPGTAYGYYRIEDITRTRDFIFKKMSKHKIDFSGYYYCPHHPRGTISRYAKKCRCRKPKIGMFLHAAKELRIDMRASWMIGDTLDDVEAGNTAGCATIFVNNGNETQWQWSQSRIPDASVRGFLEAAYFIIKNT